MTSGPGTNAARNVTKEDLEAILDSLVEGIVTLDVEGRILGINRAACEILEVDRDGALGANCCDMMGSQLCESAAAVGDSIRIGKPVADLQVQVQTRSGRKKVLVFQTRLLQDSEQRRRGSVVVLRDVSELATLKEDLARRYRLASVVGKSKPMQDVFRLVEEVADSVATVLVEGESGTGKELIARAIHHLSPRSAGPFVAVNCSALAEGVLESELFGHVEGAFTGALRDKRGRFEAAGGGTIFLDEIGDLGPAVQVKLLRVLQERTIERVGGEEPIPVDIRVIAATHHHLADLVAEGRFRQDLYYRLRVVPIELPPLRQRRDDLPLLAQHFVERFREETGRPIEGLGSEALALVIDYAWPGNVRELENAIEYAFVKARAGSIGPEHLPPELQAVAQAREPHLQGPHKIKSTDVPMSPARPVEGAADSESIGEALASTGWNVAKAARRLRISRTTLYKRITQLGIRRPDE